MVDVSDSKGGAVVMSIQPVSSSTNTVTINDPEESWSIVDEDPPLKVL